MNGMGRVSRCVVLALLLVLGGCATPRREAPPPTGTATWQVELPPGTVRYELALGEVSSGAGPIRRVSPVYPVGELAACPPPQEVPALLVVDGAGTVEAVRVAGEAQADPRRRAFIDAVRSAALQWRFAPLQIDRWAADADGNSHVVDSATRPFSLGYRFRFECHAGQPSVSAAAAPP